MASKSVTIFTESKLIEKIELFEKQLLDFFETLKNNQNIPENILTKITKNINNFILNYITKNKAKLNKTALNKLSKKAKKLQQYLTALKYFTAHIIDFKPDAIACYLSLKALLEKPIKTLKKTTKKQPKNMDLFYGDILEIAKIKLARILTELKYFDAHTPFSMFLPQFQTESEVQKILQPFQERAKYIEHLNDIKQELKKLKQALLAIPESQELLTHISQVFTRLSHLRAEYTRMPLLLKKQVLMAPIFPRPPQRPLKQTP